MLTSLGLLNKVLRGLRRDVLQAVATTDSYHLLLLQFLNSAKEEYEDQWDWHSLRQTVTVTLAPSQVAYTLTEALEADLDVSPRSRLLYERPAIGSLDEFSLETSDPVYGSQPQVFDVTDGTEFRLEEITPEQMERLHFTDNDETNTPSSFALYRDANSLLMKVWPTPSGARTWKMRFLIPQTEIPNSAMNSYQLKIDDRAVWTKALHTAASERGEDVGRPLSALEVEARDALYLAISRERLDADNTGFPV